MYSDTFTNGECSLPALIQTTERNCNKVLLSTGNYCCKAVIAVAPFETKKKRPIKIHKTIILARICLDRLVYQFYFSKIVTNKLLPTCNCDLNFTNQSSILHDFSQLSSFQQMTFCMLN